MKVKIGDDLPSALVFFLDNSNLVQKKDIRDLTVSGKTIIFGLPGAFTSVCSVKHLLKLSLNLLSLSLSLLFNLLLNL